MHDQDPLPEIDQSLGQHRRYAENLLVFLESRGHGIVQALCLSIAGSYKLSNDIIEFSTLTDENFQKIQGIETIVHLLDIGIEGGLFEDPQDVEHCLRNTKLAIHLVQKEIQSIVIN